jgi:hypothetical protein
MTGNQIHKILRGIIRKGKPKYGSIKGAGGIRRHNLDRLEGFGVENLNRRKHRNEKMKNSRLNEGNVAGTFDRLNKGTMGLMIQKNEKGVEWRGITLHNNRNQMTEKRNMDEWTTWNCREQMMTML